jgi:GT2 family glycosyltransferase
VYIDSGSTDGSVELAKAMGAEAVVLDLDTPFTAARARNAGFTALSGFVPDLEFVLFVDGDCEVVGTWIETAIAFLEAHREVAIACGRRRERYPQRSIYNMLCDIEWDTPIGETKACGGDALMRATAFQQVSGFRPDLIAGEEPELCVRLRARGWKIWRLDDEMTLHDAAITRFGQWWWRTLRGGYACALGASIHGAPPERHRVRESRSTWFWGLFLPLAIMVLSLLMGPMAFALFLVYPVQVVRLALRGRRTLRENWLRAAFLVLGKFPEMLGQVKFSMHHLLGRQSRLIEYK